MHITRRVVALAALTASFVLPISAHGGDASPALRYERTYAAAMFEARVRGVPIFFARHKDF